MYLMYVDESGDPGLVNSPSRYFVLSGLVVHESAWRPCLDALLAFRLRIRDYFELKLREEVHAAQFVRGSDALSRIAKHDRLTILRHFADELGALPGANLINIVVDTFRNFRGPAVQDECGLIFADGDPQKKLTQLLRRMRRHNPVPNQLGGYRSLELRRVLEDPVYRDSKLVADPVRRLVRLPALPTPCPEWLHAQEGRQPLLRTPRTDALQGSQRL